MQKKIAIVGAGKIGAAIVALLGESGDYALTLIDQDSKALDSLSQSAGVALSCRKVDVSDLAALTEALRDQDAVLNACPFHLTDSIARAAKAAKAHYFDLTEDVTSTKLVTELAATAESAMMPQCGLAPGFISIVAHDMARRFDEIHDVKLRVGALPLYPSNALKYNMTWSTEGLINEYCRPCEAVVDGKLREVLPLEGLEEFTLNGDRYEAFNTSGGLGTLCQTLDGKLRNLDYKTIRYPGHQAIMKLLTQDLGLAARQDLLKEVMESALPATLQDVIVIFVTVTGRINGRLMQENFARKVLGATLKGRRFSAIQMTTAAGICGVMDLVLTGALDDQLKDQSGFLRQEQVSLATFLANRFAWPYRAQPAVDAQDEAENAVGNRDSLSSAA